MRYMPACRWLLVALGISLAYACGSPQPKADSSAAATPAQNAPPAAARPEQALLEDLIVANRILARELDILDIQGHASARSKASPNHWYMQRFISPGGATVEDVIEYDLDSKPVNGPRNDNAREIYLHGEIYRARPDVMAVVHAHTPEFVAYGMSSVKLYTPDGPLPVWDIRPFNKGRSGIVSSPALGKAMAQALGKSQAVLLWGHGIALTGPSLQEAVARVQDLRTAARVQEAAVSMGASPTATPPNPAADASEGAETNAGAAGRAERSWGDWKQRVLAASDGKVPQTPPAEPKPETDKVAAAKRDLALANRMFTLDDLRIVDAYGHLSVRHPTDPDKYFIAPSVAAGAVKISDIVEKSINDTDLQGEAMSVHAEIYKARPDVMTVMYAETPEITAFGLTPQPIRPVVNGGLYLTEGMPILRIGRLSDPAVGREVAAALGKVHGVIIAGHGYVLTDRTVYDLTNRAFQLRENAIIQRQAMALRGSVTHLDDKPVPAGPNEGQGPGTGGQLGPPEGRHWVYWRSLVSIDK